MKITLFIEKYVRIKDSDGSFRKIEISEGEKIILDAADELNVPPYVRVMTRVNGHQYMINPVIKKYLKENDQHNSGK